MHRKGIRYPCQTHYYYALCTSPGDTCSGVVIDCWCSGVVKDIRKPEPERWWTRMECSRGQYHCTLKHQSNLEIITRRILFLKKKTNLLYAFSVLAICPLTFGQVIMTTIIIIWSELLLFLLLLSNIIIIIIIIAINIKLYQMMNNNRLGISEKKPIALDRTRIQSCWAWKFRCLDGIFSALKKIMFDGKKKVVLLRKQTRIGRTCVVRHFEDYFFNVLVFFSSSIIWPVLFWHFSFAFDPTWR